MLIALAEAAEAHGMPQFEPVHYPAEIFWSIVSFAVLFVLLHRYVLPRIRQALEERAALMAQEMAAAQKKHEEADALRAELQRQLDDIDDAARKRMATMEDEARRYRQATIDEMEANLARRQRQHMEELEDARRLALVELRRETAEMAAAAAEKLIGRHIGAEEGQAMVDEALEELVKQHEGESPSTRKH